MAAGWRRYQILMIHSGVEVRPTDRVADRHRAVKVISILHGLKYHNVTSHHYAALLTIGRITHYTPSICLSVARMLVIQQRNVAEN